MFYHDAAFGTTLFVSHLFQLSHGLESYLQAREAKRPTAVLGWMGVAGRHAPVRALSAKATHPAAKQPNLAADLCANSHENDKS